MIAVELDVAKEWGAREDWRALAESAARAAVFASSYGGLIDSGIVAEVSVKMTSNSVVQALNSTYRNKDVPTNVLSFPMIEADLLDTLTAADGGEILLGDVVLAHGVCAAEAADRKVPMDAHAAHLMVHGVLHLLGYDHVEGEGEAETMEQVERNALARIGIADPYAVTEVQT